MWKYFQIQKAMAAGAQPGFEPMEAVIVASVTEEPWLPTEGSVGTIAAIRTVELRPEIAGTITSVLFESGSRVEAGQELVKFDTRVEEATLRAAVARVNLAKASFDRQSKAVAMRASSQEEMDIAKAEVERAEADVVLVETQIAKKTIVAPFGAKLGLRQIHPGQYIDAGERLAILQSTSDELFVDFMVPQDLSTQVGLGQKVQLLSTTNMQGQVGQALAEAVVAAQESETEQATRTIRTRALVQPAPKWMRPGMSLSVLFPRGQQTTVLTIPVMSVRRATYGDHVFALVPDAEKPGMFRAKQRFITLGETIGARVIVTKGLEVNEQIAAEGSFKLREGLLVAPGGEPKSPTDSATAQTPKPAEGSYVADKK